MSLHCFVAMPFGTKEGIDFNRIYRELIKPALNEAGFDVFRADEELRAGEIRKDMFQELLLADLVLVDLSIDNPNVWYELGIRHALRARGVVQIFTRREKLPFDISSDRSLRYHEKDGAPDPAFLDNDKAAIGKFARATMDAWHGWKVSPVFSLIPQLQEQDWHELKVEGSEDSEFWHQYRQWESRVEIARRLNRPGDVMVLSDETPTWVMRLEAKRMAGKALTRLSSYRMALEEFEEALEINPADVESRRQRAILLGRLSKREEARELIDSLLEEKESDAESLALMGRIRKEDWIERWRKPNRSSAQMRELAKREEAKLHEAVKPYLHAFTIDSSNYYAGINALTLSRLHADLGGRTPVKVAQTDLEGGVQWSCLSALARDDTDYWASASLAELKLFCVEQDKVVQHFRDAFAKANNDWFALDSTRQQLLILRDLDVRSDIVNAVLAELDLELQNAQAPLQPEKVFLFSGHMIDAPGRAKPRFPADKEPLAAKAIIDRLDQLKAGATDLAICSGACGGDILFAEECLKRGLKLHLHLPFEEPKFLTESVSFPADGEKWRERFMALKAHANTTVLVMPDELGDLPRERNAYERVNVWQLYTALAFGADKVRFLCLWNGEGGDGPGGTKHMLEEVRKRAGQVFVLDTKSLFGMP